MWRKEIVESNTVCTHTRRRSQNQSTRKTLHARTALLRGGSTVLYVLYSVHTYGYALYCEKQFAHPHAKLDAHGPQRNERARSIVWGKYMPGAAPHMRAHVRQAITVALTVLYKVS